MKFILTILTCLLLSCENSKQQQSSDLQLKNTNLERQEKVIAPDFMFNFLSNPDLENNTEEEEEEENKIILSRLHDKAENIVLPTSEGLDSVEDTYTNSEKKFDFYPLVVDPITKPVINKQDPITHSFVFGTSTVLKWLHHSEATHYRVYRRYITGNSFRLHADNVKEKEFVDYTTVAGQAYTFRVAAVTPIGEVVIGRKDIVVPSTPDTMKASPLPEPFTDPPHKTFEISVNTSTGEDLTNVIIEKFNAIPNGTPELYHKIKFTDENGRYWTEGDLANNPRGFKGVLPMIGRGYLILEGIDENFTTFYTTAPAVGFNTHPKQNTHSERAHFKLRQCVNIIFRNIAVEGGNIIEGQKVAEVKPVWWERDTPDTGAPAGAAVWHPGWELEHGFDVRNSKNIRFENVFVKGVFGDGIYWSHSSGVEIFNTTVEMTGRQGYGVSNKATNWKVIKSNSIAPRRAAFDMEAMKGGIINNGLIDGCKFYGHLVAGGSGPANNITIKNTGYQGGLRCLGSEENPRENWKIIDSYRMGKFGSGVTAVTFLYTHNVTFERNREAITTDQGRHGILIQDCSGEIRVVDNDFLNPSIIEVVDSGENVTIEGNTPQAKEIQLRSGEIKSLIVKRYNTPDRN